MLSREDFHQLFPLGFPESQQLAFCPRATITSQTLAAAELSAQEYVGFAPQDNFPQWASPPEECDKRLVEGVVEVVCFESCNPLKDLGPCRISILLIYKNHSYWPRIRAIVSIATSRVSEEWTVCRAKS